MIMCSRDISGVPTLSPVNTKILLRGRGVCRKITDIPVEEGRATNKRRKWRLTYKDSLNEPFQELNILVEKPTPMKKKCSNLIIPLKSMSQENINVE